MQNTNLLLHCGAAKVERDWLGLIAPPKATETWFPIPHERLVREVETALWKVNMRVANQAHGLSPDGFNAWVAKVKGGGTALDADAYRKLERPSEAAPVTYFSSVKPGLYDSILNLCADPGKMCMNQMMAIDAAGGGKAGDEDVRDSLKYDGAHLKDGNEAPGATFPASGRPPNSDVQPQGMKDRSISPVKNERKTSADEGQGHAMPGARNTPGMRGNLAPAQMNDH